MERHFLKELHSQAVAAAYIANCQARKVRELEKKLSTARMWVWIFGIWAILPPVVSLIQSFIR